MRVVFSEVWKLEAVKSSRALGANMLWDFSFEQWPYKVPALLCLCVGQEGM